MGKGMQVSFWREKRLPHRSFVDTFRMGFGLIAHIRRQVFGGTIESQKRAGEQPADCRRSVDVYWESASCRYIFSCKHSLANLLSCAGHLFGFARRQRGVTSYQKFEIHF